MILVIGIFQLGLWFIWCSELTGTPLFSQYPNDKSVNVSVPKESVAIIENKAVPNSSMQCIFKRKGVFLRHPVSTNNVKRVKRTTNGNQLLAIGSDSDSLRAGVAIVDRAHSVTTEWMVHDNTQNSSCCQPMVSSQIYSDPTPENNNLASFAPILSFTLCFPFSFV